MDLKLFETFRAVLEEGTVVRAAARLRVSQPTVSKAVASLERSLGFALFNHEKRRLTPTQEALALYDEVSRAWRGLDALPGIARAVGRQTDGRLTVGANPTLSCGFVQRLIALFLAAHPRVSIHLECGSGRDLVRGVVDGTIDIAFATRPGHADGEARAATVPSTPVATGLLVCVLPRNHPLTSRRVVAAGDLTPYPFIALTTVPEARRSVDGVFGVAGGPAMIAAETSSAQAACHLAAAGVGATIVGSITAHAAATADGAAIEIRPLTPDVTFTIDYALGKQAAKSVLAGSFARLAREHSPAILAELTGAAGPDGTAAPEAARLRSLRRAANTVPDDHAAARRRA